MPKGNGSSKTLLNRLPSLYLAYVIPTIGQLRVPQFYWLQTEMLPSKVRKIYEQNYFLSLEHNRNNFCSLFVKVLSNSSGFVYFICKLCITSRNSSSRKLTSGLVLYFCLLQLFMFVALHVANLLSFKRIVLNHEQQSEQQK